MNGISQREADRFDVTVLVDNYADILLMEQTDTLRRAMIPPPTTLYAEHGLACLVTMYAGTEKHSVLLDGGISPVCLIHNAEVLNVNPGDIEAIALSHGHFDHFGGLIPMLQGMGGSIPLFLHPDAFLERRINIPMVGRAVPMPRLDSGALEGAGAEIRASEDASLLAGGLLSLTGEIERKTPYEKGFPWMEAEIDGRWIVDPFRDDQALVAVLRGKGLVVISGCAHAGIVNTVEHAKRMSGIEQVHAILGGFHLTGPLFEPVIPQTIAGIRAIGPAWIVPMHCTGWNAITRFAGAFPERFILNTVGTTCTFQGT
ncbi:MAG: MBL fold metallo-hydrolase [Methanomicrobiales archaeon]|nr:MBL fold metallo-hydrolase [Methanomicrobiales archaeon]